MPSFSTADQIKPLDCIRHETKGGIYVVKAINGDKLYLLDSNGYEANYMFRGQFGPATEAEAASLEKLVIRMQIKSTARPPKTVSPEEVRAQFEKYVDSLSEKNAEAAKNFRKFWDQLIQIAGDQPGESWAMRESKKLGVNPVLKIISKTSGKFVNLAHFWGGETNRNELSIMIVKAHLPKELKDHFPNKKTYYGSGDSIDIKYEDLANGVGEKYLNCFKTILKPKAPIAT